MMMTTWCVDEHINTLLDGIKVKPFYKVVNIIQDQLYEYVSFTAFSSTTVFGYFYANLTYSPNISATTLYQNTHINLSSNISKWFDASKIHQSFIIKLIIHKEYYFIFTLN
jgi:hypothetical protein